MLDEIAQRAWKAQQVRSALARIGGINAPVHAILEAHAPTAYRNSLDREPGRNLRSGHLRAGESPHGGHRSLPRPQPPLPDLKLDLEQQDWPADVDLRRDGGLRHLELRVGARAGEVLVVLVSSHDWLPGLAQLATRWMRRWPQVIGVVLNI